MSKEYWIIALRPVDNNWYILDSRNMSVIAGPYGTHEDAMIGMNTRLFRLAQGWAP